MSLNPVENTPRHTQDGEGGFNPVDPPVDEGYGSKPYEGASGRHVDPDVQPDAYREDSVNADSNFTDDGAPVTAEVSDEHHVDHHANEHHVEGESLTQHKPGESFKEWIAADIQQTKEDLHISKKHD